mmetsp:Transcript_5900/g.832  ORF Transcript_5900/g.832 Transcript_5900/m.832 type:complete len:117 (-) Transcript_5900:85-435(-)
MIFKEMCIKMMKKMKTLKSLTQPLGVLCNIDSENPNKIHNKRMKMMNLSLTQEINQWLINLKKILNPMLDLVPRLEDLTIKIKLLFLDLGNITIPILTLGTKEPIIYYSQKFEPTF